MRNILFTLLFVLGGTLSLHAQASGARLKFRANGEFLIMQVTDCHYKYGKSASETCVRMLNTVLDAEDVDLVVFTGDNVYSDNVREGLKAILEPVEKRNIPFVALFGNHDHQFDMEQDLQWDFFRTYSNNVQPDRPSGGTYPDFVLPLYASKGSKVSQLVYCLDSHAAYRIRAISRYDWIHYDQIAWYRQQSRRFTRENGGTPLPAVAFFHIALPEFAEAFDYFSGGKKMKTGVPGVVGEKGENVCCPKLNSGFFKSMLECGDVRGVFCGHDHDNDYALVWKNIMLAYGRYSGGNTVYNNIGKNGVRMIVLHEGAKTMDTYIRLNDGSQINYCTYPSDFK